MAVSVLGINYDNEGTGLQGMLDATFKAHAENGDILLNLRDAEAARKVGERGPKQNAKRVYEHQPFPRDMHHADGRTRTVPDPAGLKAALTDGFREAPYPVVRVAPADPAAEKAQRIAQDTETAGKIASQNAQLQEQNAQLQKLLMQIEELKNGMAVSDPTDGAKKK